MPILKGIAQLAQCLDKGAQDDIHVISSAALVWQNDKICWLGCEKDTPQEYANEEVWDAKGCLVVPGLIDCHTHLCFGGWRAEEFEARMRGASYLEIAKSGGGILSTVKDTRALSLEQLKVRGAGFLQEIYKLGVTTVEAKSGYGLSLQDELKILGAYQALKEDGHQIVATLLAAHTVPEEFKDNRAAYVSLVCNEIIPAVAEKNLAQFCDVFLESSAFNYAEAEQVLKAGIDNGLRPKIHADQLSDGNGAALAAELKAVSADHLECISASNIEKLKSSNVVAVTLPLASLYTHQTALDARALIEAKISVAVATDFNPGSAPSFDLHLAMLLACTLNRMTPAQALKGTTIYAAKAISQEAEIGSLEVGKQADFALIDAANINDWLYNFKAGRCRMTVRAGEKIFSVY